eukprot:CAMPEP_0168606036 /NCGR_PEP_ID=MMETSP0420-20121227/16316_1 /TAXON_ID=498008 /ORGANISM="Pessonella sp." /LENGTH=266 /DNA_ID=CAMNT_0008645593 /DNA_START=1017 /DNA_END=1814 /DNA_ORIENTATION=-
MTRLENYEQAHQALLDIEETERMAAAEQAAKNQGDAMKEEEEEDSRRNRAPGDFDDDDDDDFEVRESSNVHVDSDDDDDFGDDEDDDEEEDDDDDDDDEDDDEDDDDDDEIDKLGEIDSDEEELARREAAEEALFEREFASLMQTSSSEGRQTKSDISNMVLPVGVSNTSASRGRARVVTDEPVKNLKVLFHKGAGQKGFSARTLAVPQSQGIAHTAEQHALEDAKERNQLKNYVLQRMAVDQEAEERQHLMGIPSNHGNQKQRRK